jgi:hypothetical protein
LLGICSILEPHPQPLSLSLCQKGLQPALYWMLFLCTEVDPEVDSPRCRALSMASNWCSGAVYLPLSMTGTKPWWRFSFVLPQPPVLPLSAPDKLQNKDHWGHGVHNCLACPTRVSPCLRGSQAFFVPVPCGPPYQVCKAWST